MFTIHVNKGVTNMKVRKKPEEMRGYERYLVRFQGYINDPEEARLMVCAYRLGKWAHRGEYRGDGVTYYFKHLRDVADLVSCELGIKDDWQMNVVTWLHDAVEADKLSLDKIERLFGSTVRYWVELLSKGEDYKRDKLSYIRQMREAGSIEVIILKLADRVANLRTLGFKADPEFQIKQINETIREYVPLARYLLELMEQSSHWQSPTRIYVGEHLLEALLLQINSFRREYGDRIIADV